MFTNWKKKYEKEVNNHLNTRNRLFFLENYFGNKFVKNDRIIIRESEEDPKFWCISSINFGGEADGMSRYALIEKDSEFGVEISKRFNRLTKLPCHGAEFFEVEPE